MISSKFVPKDVLYLLEMIFKAEQNKEPYFVFDPPTYSAQKAVGNAKLSALVQLIHSDNLICDPWHDGIQVGGELQIILPKIYGLTWKGRELLEKLRVELAPPSGKRGIRQVKL